MGPDLSYQQKLTTVLVTGYFAVILAWTAGMVMLVLWAAGSAGFDVFGAPLADLPTWTAALIAWAEGVIGGQLGTLTKMTSDAVQFQVGSSVGSKTKDFKPGA